MIQKLILKSILSIQSEKLVIKKYINMVNIYVKCYFILTIGIVITETLQDPSDFIILLSPLNLILLNLDLKIKTCGLI